MQKKKEFGLLNLIIVIVIASLVSSITTGVIMFNHQNKNKITDFTKDKDLQEFLKVYDEVSDEFYEDVDNKKLIEGAINGMMSYFGDDYTTYLNENATESLEQQLVGKYNGVGIQLTEGNVIYSVFDKSPAQEAGLMQGDIITKVNDEDVTALTPSDIANKIKETDGDIRITVKRNEEEITLVVWKKDLLIPTVEKEIYADNNGKRTGYIKISSFSNTAYQQFNEKLKDLENNNINNLIIDVRNNTGGYLKAASDISKLFLDKGKVIYSLEAKTGKEVYKDDSKDKRDYKIVILINESSASASEILAAALKDSYGATLVGKKSFGKGKVQQTYTLSNGNMVKYTSAKWLRPNGDCIDKVGLIPDHEIDLELDENNYMINDTQLNKALELLGE